MATRSTILAWEIPWQEPGGLQSMGLQRAGHNWVTNTHTHTHTHPYTHTHNQYDHPSSCTGELEEWALPLTAFSRGTAGRSGMTQNWFRVFSWEQPKARLWRLAETRAEGPGVSASHSCQGLHSPSFLSTSCTFCDSPKGKVNSRRVPSWPWWQQRLLAPGHIPFQTSQTLGYKGLVAQSLGEWVWGLG